MGQFSQTPRRIANRGSASTPTGGEPARRSYWRVLTHAPSLPQVVIAHRKGVALAHGDYLGRSHRRRGSTRRTMSAARPVVEHEPEQQDSRPRRTARRSETLATLARDTELRTHRRAIEPTTTPGRAVHVPRHRPGHGQDVRDAPRRP